MDKDDIPIWIIILSGIISYYYNGFSLSFFINALLYVFYLIAIIPIWKKEKIIYDEDRRKKK